jgi:hypothetical protein
MRSLFRREVVGRAARDSARPSVLVGVDGSALARPHVKWQRRKWGLHPIGREQVRRRPRETGVDGGVAYLSAHYECFLDDLESDPRRFVLSRYSHMYKEEGTSWAFRHRPASPCPFQQFTCLREYIIQ